MIYEPYMYATDMRALEECAVRNGMSYIELMENAGKSASSYLIEHKRITERSSVLILSGTGNNGGDGYVMAYRLAEAFPDQLLTVFALGGNPKSETALEMYKRATICTNITIIPIASVEDIERCNDIFAKTTVVIDAVYGIGFHGALPFLAIEVFNRVRTVGAYTVAVDIPSGMGADDGYADPHILKADVTLTFASQKRCGLLEETRGLCGEVVVCDIGIPADLMTEHQILPTIINDELVSKGIPARVQNSHKGTYGSVHSLTGSYGMAGAAMLSGKAALRCGIGLLHYWIPKSIYPIVSSQIWEAVYHPIEETAEGGLSLAELEPLASMLSQSQKGAFLCGPGLSRNTNTASFVRKLLPKLTLPMVVDADGLNAYIGHIDEWKAITSCGRSLVLTPHPAEAARLLACTVDDVERDRIASARRLADLTGATVVLKGHETIVANAQRLVYVNTTGCSGLAKGGSGDVLAGMIAAFVAQGINPLQACVSAVYLHGVASVCVSRNLSETGMLPTDLLDELPVLLSEYE